MASRFFSFTRKFFLITNCIVVAVFLLSCLVPYLNPQKWWFISFMGMAFPFLLAIVFIYLLGWLLSGQKRYALLSVMALLVGIKSISICFGFHPGNNFAAKKAPNTFRVVSWNVARFVELKRNTNAGSQTRLKMLALLKEQDADILCLQEFHTSTNEIYYDNISAVQELGYPYFYFCYDTDGDRHYYSSIIFSRHPIVDSGFVRYPRPTLPDVLLYADIKYKDDTVRVFTTHLQSLQFKRSDYQKLHNIKGADDSLLSNSKTIFSKWKKAVSNRSIQAGIVKDVVEDSPHPVVFCADLNDVPNSYTYALVRGDMQDVFLRKGFGIGRTFSGISPTLRIDYIFAGREYRIRQFDRVVKRYSDHYMLVADLELKR